MSPEELSALFDGPSTALAEGLLGCRLTVVAADGAVTVRLTETEAYGNAGEDPGAHSFRGRTERNSALFGPARRTYVYLNYGIHRCLNLVGHPQGQAGGVLLRAGEVLAGREVAVARRGRDTGARLLSGPGNLGQGLGIALDMGHLPVEIVATPPTEPVPVPPGVSARFLLAPPAADHDAARASVVRGPRVGVSGEGGSVRFPWRFHLAGDPSVSAYRRGRDVPD
ncbi:DNA-3-methyladenine glycosylase [Micrococcus flavus]|uniref:Putative 3-methyladenine DNA glycosylase n=1 Tax=Micrococcus flavus TaxID=384602 RepID=A0A4Y8WYF8_9MICC|nr:DNA-3-methyladenine glycosylase [Micrococcus flavus]MBB4883704.1 DNA-3-methyladenine glycosylase [Micrococcus flavus]TFI00609.1 DNA-3-methyladenine glycosylase [Micrococcus flavus]GGK48359.1 putative 3-methyladenine DNA glycosylase [Micrococcus flavus]